MTPASPSPEAFAAAYEAVGASNRRSLDRLAVMLRALQERGIDALLLKGADILTRPDAPLGLRGIGDVDLLVHDQDLDAIDSVMRGLGLKPKIDGNAAYIDDEGSFPVDLACRIWYLEDERAVWSRAVSRPALGLTVRAMESTDALLYTALWVCLHRARLSPALAQDVQRLSAGGVDWDRLIGEARALGLAAPLHHSLSYASEKRAGAVPERVLCALAPKTSCERAKSRLLSRLVTEEKLEGLSHLLVALTRPRGRRLRGLARTVVPDARFMRYRYGERAGLLMRLWRPIRLAWDAVRLSSRILVRLAGISSSAPGRMA